MLNEFTPVESGLGGLLVGLSAASVLLVHGCAQRRPPRQSRGATQHAATHPVAPPP